MIPADIITGFGQLLATVDQVAENALSADDIIARFGLLLAACLVGGMIAEWIHVPKVTAYLLSGLLLGPSVLGVISESQLKTFHPLTQLAMAMVLFNIGCHFPVAHVRRFIDRAAKLSLGELLLTFSLVTAGLLLLGQDWKTSILLGCLALATAPATTILVLKEFHSEGLVTEFVNILVALNNLAAIVCFEFALLAVAISSGSQDLSIWDPIATLFLSVLGSLSLGVIAGLAISYLCDLLGVGRWLVILVAVSTILLGLCETFEWPYMLTFIAVGTVVANASDSSKSIVRELDNLNGLLAVIFFGVHGAGLEMTTFLHLGWIGAVYIICRTLGKCLGIYSAATLIGEPREVRLWLGPALLAQAGAAIALAHILEDDFPVLGGSVKAIILGSVVVFEIMGPILIRQSVLRSGEVPLAHAIHHTSHTPLGQLRDLRDRLLTAIGRDPYAKVEAGALSIRDLVRRNVKGVSQSASLDEVVSHMEQSHDNTYPVVDDQTQVVGVIRYADLSKYLFDPTVGFLVRAEDLLTPTRCILHLDDPAATAFELFENSTDDCFPVVSSRPEDRLVGIVRRADVKTLLIRKHRNA